MAARASWRERPSLLSRSFQSASIESGVEMKPTNGQQGTGDKIENTNAMNASDKRVGFSCGAGCEAGLLVGVLLNWVTEC